MARTKLTGDQINSATMEAITSSGDITILSDEKTLSQRRTGGLTAPTDDFNSTAAGWGYATTPFVIGTFNTSSFTSIGILSITTAGSSRRTFLYKDVTPTTYTALNPGGNFATVGAYHGVRWDDGSDNNYVEARWVLTAASPRALKVQSAFRTGGGAVSVADGPVTDLPIPAIVRLQVGVTKWSNWSVSAYYGMDFGATDMPRVGGAYYATGLTWTPTRVGIVAYDGGGSSTTERFASDWYLEA
jgi:hypothetical protein